MAHPRYDYDPYYHHHLRPQPPPDYYYHHAAAVETTVPTYITATKLHSTNNINKIPIRIPKEKAHINTLFVSGLPDDVLPREIHNLFCRRSGFDSCQLKFTGRGNQVVAFVTFYNHQSAVLALQALDGVQFDPQDGTTVLHIELARSNSRRKRKSGSGPYVVIDKRRKVANATEEMYSEDGDNESNNSHQNEDHNSSSDDEQSDEKSDVKKADLKDPEDAANKETEKTSVDLQPCSTLFIANLGSKCNEEELKQALSEYPGFKGLKRRVKGTVAFADYEEVEQATNAMQGLQGSTLPSSDKGAMVIEYARSKMRKA